MSTVTTADQILVLHAGKVAEAGTHQELLAIKGGRYANMWRKQIRAERAAEAASHAVAKASALQKAVMERPGSSGNEGTPSEDVSENEVDTMVTSLTSQTLANEIDAGMTDPKAFDSFVEHKSDGQIQGQETPLAGNSEELRE